VNADAYLHHPPPHRLKYLTLLYIKPFHSLLLLLQSALQPLWVLACPTIVEYSQQEGFNRVPLPAARQTPNLEDQWLEHSNSHHQVYLTSETTRANPSSRRWNYGREISENFAESSDFHVTFEFFYDMGPTALLPLRRKARWGFFSHEKSDGFSRVWTRDLGYQKPARSPLDHRSR